MKKLLALFLIAVFITACGVTDEPEISKETEPKAEESEPNIIPLEIEDIICFTEFSRILRANFTGMEIVDMQGIHCNYSGGMTINMFLNASEETFFSKATPPTNFFICEETLELLQRPHNAEKLQNNSGINIDDVLAIAISIKDLKVDDGARTMQQEWFLFDNTENKYSTNIYFNAWLNYDELHVINLGK